MQIHIGPCGKMGVSEKEIGAAFTIAFTEGRWKVVFFLK